jgi:hypothetical protein
MAFDNPWYTTQTSPGWSVPVQTDSGGTVNLTNVQLSDLTVFFKNTVNGASTQGTGTLHIDQVNPGQISYEPSPTDVANRGTFRVTLWVNFQTGPEAFELGIWEILPK